jgi:hypothetical protein
LVAVTFLGNLVLPKLFSFGDGGADLFSPAFIYLSLVGFVGSMIFGVELKTVAFRLTNYRRNISKITAALQAVSIVLAFSSCFEGFKFLLPLANAFFLASAVSFSVAARALEWKPRSSKVLLPITAGRSNVASHSTISHYTDVCLFSSVSWLLFGCALGVILSFANVPSFFAVRDSFIHSIAVGFIGSAVSAYGPVLLPGVLSKKGPRQHLSLLPLGFLNAGLAIRVVGNFYSIERGTLPLWESLSGLMIVVAMILLMKNMHFRSKV